MRMNERTLINTIRKSLLGVMWIVLVLGMMPAACSDASNATFPVKRLFESKDHYTGPIATKIAEFQDGSLSQDIKNFKDGGLISLVSANEIWSLVFSPDGKYLATGPAMGTNVRVWSWQGSSHIVQNLTIPSSTVTESGLRFSPDGRLLAVGHDRWVNQDSVVRIWNAESGVVDHEIHDPNGGGRPLSLAFSPGGQWMIRLDGQMDPARPVDTVLAYSTSTWEKVWGLRTYPFHPKTVEISPDGKFAAVGGDVIAPGVADDPTSILIIDLTKHVILRRIGTPEMSGADHLAWSPDGKNIVAGGVIDGGYGGIRLFDAISGRAIADESRQGGRISAVSYARDGAYLIVSRSGGGVEIWDGSLKTLLQEIPTKSAGATTVSQDGRYLAVVDFSRISIWELKK